MRQQYHFRPSSNGFFAWDVYRLVQLSKSLPIEWVNLESIAELDEAYWYGTGNVPTCRSIAHHFRLMQATDLKHPIILCADGRLMDGMHRVIKAHAQGDSTIQAVRFEVTPTPDFKDVQPEELPY